MISLFHFEWNKTDSETSHTTLFTALSEVKNILDLKLPAINNSRLRMGSTSWPPSTTSAPPTPSTAREPTLK